MVGGGVVVGLVTGLIALGEKTPHVFDVGMVGEKEEGGRQRGGPTQPQTQPHFRRERHHFEPPVEVRMARKASDGGLRARTAHSVSGAGEKEQWLSRLPLCKRPPPTQNLPCHCCDHDPATSLCCVLFFH